MSKKNKKNKWKSVDVTTVLAETRPVATSWADEAEIDERDIQIAAARKSTLPTAPRSARGTDDERVPNAPPYVAYITNIPFELIEDDIVEFFGELQIENIRLPRNDATGKLKGYGYVEFTERQGLIEALGIGDKSMKGRRIRIEVSENSDRDRGGFGRSDRMGRDRMGMDRDYEYDPERTAGDWRSGPRSEPAGEDRMRSGGRSGYGSGGFGDRDGDRGGDRGGFGAPRESDNREGGWREGMGSGTGGSSAFGDRDRDRDSFRSRGFGDRDRGGGGGFGDRDRGGSGFGDRDRGYDRPRDGGYDRPRDGGYDRPRYGDRDGDRYGGDRPRFGDRDREDGERFARRDDAPPSEQSGEPRARPKLNLAPRTRPVENPLPPPEEVREERPVEEKPAPAPAPSVPRASIFGSAKPVDTTAREREIEDRLARERDRAPRREELDRNTENSRSKESNEDGDEQSKKIEPAPPPKENAWSRRPRVETDNGDSDRATSPGSNEDRGRPGSQNENTDNRRNRSGSRDQQDNRGTSQDDSNSDRPSQKDHSNEDQPRLPKYEEKSIPNFVGSNKFAHLKEDGDPEGASD